MLIIFYIVTLSLSTNQLLFQCNSNTSKKEISKFANNMPKRKLLKKKIKNELKLNLLWNICNFLFCDNIFGINSEYKQQSM